MEMVGEETGTTTEGETGTKELEGDTLLFLEILHIAIRFNVDFMITSSFP